MPDLKPESEWLAVVKVPWFAGRGDPYQPQTIQVWVPAETEAQARLWLEQNGPCEVVSLQHVEPGE